ncbi:MAG: hypothetical protein O7B26_12855 [Planctomycetota bacterium]|nr:hypothetical protein [Planctomycetota bacterium]
MTRALELYDFILLKAMPETGIARSSQPPQGTKYRVGSQIFSHQCVESPFVVGDSSE